MVFHTGRQERVAGDLVASEETLDSASLLPEALLQDRWLDALEKQGFSDRVRAVVVDEGSLCLQVFAQYQYELGERSYYAPGSPHLSEYRLFGMFHADTSHHNKDVILQSLLHPDGVVRVVFATVALGMGVNLKGVNTIIHYGAPRSVEDYFQESGRGGRSGEDAVSTVYWKPHNCPISKNPVTLRERELIAVRRYLENTELCRRRWLLDHFDVKVGTAVQQCCDVCSNTVEVQGWIWGAFRGFEPPLRQFGHYYSL